MIVYYILFLGFYEVIGDIMVLFVLMLKYLYKIGFLKNFINDKGFVVFYIILYILLYLDGFLKRVFNFFVLGYLY